MNHLCFARVWCVLVVALAILVVAGPTSGRIVDSEATGSFTRGLTPLSTVGNWEVGTSPNPGGWGNIIWGMTALTQTDVWAVGVQATFTSNDPLAIHWNGTSWTAVPTPTPVPDCEDGNIQWAGNSLNAVDGVSARDVWAVGGTCYGMNTLLEHWDGTEWSMVPGASQPKGDGDWATLSGVTAISSSNVWAVGYRSSGALEALIEHWDGNHWSIVPGARLAGSDSYLSAVTATGPNDVWAIGGSDGSNVIEHFDGNGWSVVATPQPQGSILEGITALSPTDVWAVGYQRNGAHLTLVLHYDGSSWTVVPSPNPSTAYNADNELRSVAALAPDDIWAVGMYQNEQTSIHQHRTLIEHWDGTSWSIVSSPSPGHSSELNAAAVPTRQTGPVTGARVFASGLFSNYDINIYDGTYTDPRTLVMSST
jgi:hypothetical protein